MTACERRDDTQMLPNLDGFHSYMENILRDWNAPGIGVGIVKDNELVFAQGYGYRDYENKLPFTASTVFQIASNSKLFTAVACGFLVEEGLLTYDEPIRDAVPSLRFSTDELNKTVTLRDMLAHRTGITRHDSIWYKSNFTGKELFEKVRFLEPSAGLRQTFLYNNMMYEAAGYVIELLTGKTWEEVVRERLFVPLGMDSSGFQIGDLLAQPDFAVPFNEKRDSTELHKIPYYDDGRGSPAGSIVSNIEDLSHWLIALMSKGDYAGKNVIPQSILAATLEPAVALPNTLGETRGFWEVTNPAYGMGRHTASYRGYLLTYHGGALPGFYSQVSFMPQERIGVIVCVIGEHCAVLTDPISYNVYERLLGIDQTPWSERWLKLIEKGKVESRTARAKAGANRIPKTSPSHALSDYAGEYEHPAYGVLTIGLQAGQLQFRFHRISLPLSHFHYDRFDTVDDEQEGKWSVNFFIDPQGDIDKAVMSLDEAEVTFVRRPEHIDGERLKKCVGTYEDQLGNKIEITFKNEQELSIKFPGIPLEKLIPRKDLQFRLEKFSDRVLEFIEQNGRVTAFKLITPTGESISKKAILTEKED